MPDVPFAISDDHKILINRLVNEVRNQRVIGAQRGGEATLQPLDRNSPFVTTNHAYLDKWNPLVESVNAGTKPPTLPPGTATQLGPFDTGSISFDNGVPVGANASLLLRQDGSFTFTGHFHDSGATSYNTAFAWVIVDKSGRAYTFSHSGRTSGTFESGSRDDDWTNNGTNPDIAANWLDLTTSYHWRWQANVNLDITSLVNSLVSAIKAAGTVIATVISVV